MGVGNLGSVDKECPLPSQQTKDGVAVKPSASPDRASRGDSGWIQKEDTDARLGKAHTTEVTSLNSF